MMTIKNWVFLIVYFKVANIIFLGVADDPKIVGKLKCNTWFQLQTKSKTVTLSGNRHSVAVRYFLRYLCYMLIVIFQDFFPNFKVTLCIPL